ncbi:hypothetical protein [Planctomicrobium piriforme]|uniref:Uncharacterized protein n=1 Tax=Planctomicrobium piriforme TaxID=1576369 RepID=A0A1I3F8F4_9PLAN|nr:hypothetical protein [Planctomicrobium piriforme]SFI07505.1 hypothetical protein SAMN05421753_105127 [Planctomicrobium piriforme]
MASKRLLDKRREHEAAEKQGKVKKETPTTAKKGARKPVVRKRKTKAPERKRLMWGVFSGTLKEEGRYAWNEKDKADEKLALLRSKSKKQYFIQPIKESLNESIASKEEEVEEVAAVVDEEEVLDEEALADDEDEAEELEDDGEEE